MNSSEISEKDVLINSVFHLNFQSKFTFLIKDTKNLKNIFELLDQYDDNDKQAIFEVFDNCAKKVLHNSKILMSIILRNDSFNAKNLLTILCDIYINTSNVQLIKTIKELLTTLSNNGNITKENLDFVYQKLSIYFRDNKMEITQELLIKYIDILKILYGENMNNPFPRNYFYFSGSSSIRINELILEEERIKLNNVK